jgi:hypothetical protein
LRHPLLPNGVEVSTVFLDFSSAASLAATIGIPSMRIIVHAPYDRFVGAALSAFRIQTSRATKPVITNG